MDQGIVIPRYRPDLGIGKSFIDYHATDNPAFDGIASTSIAKMDYIDRPIAQPSHWSRSGKQNVHVRQNFVGRGRAGGYIPPQTDSPECRAGKALDTRRANDTTNSPEELIHVPQHDLTEDEAFPCDELDPPGRLFRSVERQAEERKGQFSFDLVNERLKPLMTITQHCGGNHFSIKGPRYSDPSSPIVNQQVDDYPINLNECAKVADCGISEPIPNKNETNVELYESSGKALSPTKRSARNCRHHSVESTECGQMEDEDDPFLGLEISDEVELRFPEGGERPVKIAHKIRRRSPMNLDGADGELEGSSDDNMKQKRRSPSNLQERTQQAWKSRRQKNSSLRSKRDPQTPRSTNRVSFKGSDTVKYFEPNVDELTDDATEEITIELDDEVADEGTDETATSLDEKSLNSEYTKGLESEVEDMIKDIFFIGNGATSQPGRRKYKHKHEVKKRLRQKDLGMIRIAEDEYRQSEDDDLDSLSRSRNKGRKNDSASKSAGQKPSNQCAQNIKNRKTNDIRSGKQSGKSLSGMAEAESSVWSFVEGSFTAVSSALGLTQEEEAFALKKSKQESSFTESTCPGPILPFETCPLRLTPSHSSTKPAMSDLYVYAQDVVYGPLSKANELTTISDSTDSQESNRGRGKSSPPKGRIALNEDSRELEDIPVCVNSLDEDLEVLELALHAAKSYHQSQGVEFDVTHHLHLHDDVQISVVELKLPLGLVFLENDGGCFVTKVAPGGSAARSGGVEVGDQLAAINGSSGIRMKVEDISDMISKSANPDRIELVFVRYIGPFCPIRKSGLRIVGPGHVGNTTEHSPASIKPRSAGQLISEYAPQEQAQKKKGFRLFGRTKRRVSKRVV